MIGYNTDAPGFYKSIEEFGKLNNVLILGAGGTTKAISEILKDNSIDVTILNRSENRLDFFKDRGFRTFSWSNFEVDKYELTDL